MSQASKIVINHPNELRPFYTSKDKCNIHGDLTINCSICVNSLYVTGDIYAAGDAFMEVRQSIKAGGRITSYSSIKAGGYIKAGSLGGIRVYGFISSRSFIETPGHIYTRTSIHADGFIDAGGGIYAGNTISSGEFVKSGFSIHSGRNITVDEFIDAKESIYAYGWIRAGGHIDSGEYIFSYQFHVSCESMKTKALPMDVKYYKAMPPFAPFADKIHFLWDELRNIGTHEDHKRICAWEGWHPLIKCQLEMFFGLKTEHRMATNT